MTLVCVLTLARIPLAIVFAVVYLTLTDPAHRTPRMVIALVILALIELTDFLDGFLARRMKATSEWGAMLDPYADSFSRLVVYWTLAQANAALAAVPLVMALRDVTVAYCRVTLARGQQSVKANWSGKTKAAVQGATAFAIVIVIGLADSPASAARVTAVLSWIVMLTTAASAIEYVRAAILSSSKK